MGSFQTGKTPCNDGIPIEVNKTFCPLIGEFMVNSFNEAYDNKEMSSSQRQAIITLIEKKGKDRNYLMNWRPISLTNVDAKIASKVIATKIILVLPDIIITSTQTGYVLFIKFSTSDNAIPAFYWFTVSQLPAIIPTFDLIWKLMQKMSNFLWEAKFRRQTNG